MCVINAILSPLDKYGISNQTFTCMISILLWNREHVHHLMQQHSKSPDVCGDGMEFAIDDEWWFMWEVSPYSSKQDIFNIEQFLEVSHDQ